jgi:HD superfamily phosphohydrolase
LFQTDASARLRDISVSSVPSNFSPHGMPASRFQHSAAVSHLAYLAGHHLELDQGLCDHLVAAAILHDAGSPPFSHISESFMHNLLGHHHEDEVARVLEQDESVREALHKHGVESAPVLEILTGEHPRVGKLLAGSIDLDNIDNSLHLLHSLTGLTPLPYNPEHLVQAFCWKDGQLALHSDHLADVLAWEDTRERLYRVLYQPVNLSAAAGLYRALGLAYQQNSLGEEFFRMREDQALRFLSDLGGGIREIVHDLATWHHYPEVLRWEDQASTPELENLAGDTNARMEVADRVAEDLSLQRHQLAFYIGSGRGAKSIPLPWQGERSEAASNLFPGRKAKMRVALYCQGYHDQSFHRVAKESLSQAISEAKPKSGGEACF